MCLARLRNVLRIGLLEYWNIGRGIRRSHPSFQYSIIPAVLSAAAVVLSLWVVTGSAQYVAELLEEVDKLTAGGPADVRGETLVVGRNVYSWTGTGWELEATLSFAEPSLEGQFFSQSVALSQDEGRVILGDPDIDEVAGPSRSGAAVVFVRTESGWEEEARLTASDAAANDAFGVSVDISGDRIVVGAMEAVGPDGFGNGSAYIFDRDPIAGWTETAKLTVIDGASNDRFGEGVAVSGDVAIVGAPRHDGVAFGAGAAYAFGRNQGGAGNWGLEQKLVPPGLAAIDSMGEHVDVEGNTAVVGSTPAAYVFDRDSQGNWILNGSGLSPSDASELSFFAMQQVAIDHDAQTILVGEFQQDGQTGGAYLYTLQDGVWTELKKLTASDAGNGRFFGWDVSIAGDLIVVTGNFNNNHYTFVPNYTNESLLDEIARKSLYYSDADNSAAYPRDSAAFRYKHLLFARDSTDPSERLRAQFESIGAMYGSNERSRAEDVRNLIVRGLQALPESMIYHELVLDFYYDLAVAEALFAKQALERAERARFGPPISAPAPTGGFIIDNEIALYETAIAAYRAILEDSFGLLSEDFGMGGNPPAGYVIFTSRVPTRALMAATYVDGNGDHQPVVADPALSAGYRDLVLLFDLVRDYGQAVAELAKLLIARGNPGDNESAAQMADDAWRLVFVQGKVLEDLFDPLPDSSDASGLQPAMNGWRAAMTQLSDIQQIVAAKANLLGYAPDFLMLIENFEEGATFDSFNSFAERLDLIRPASMLTTSMSDLTAARNSYDTYRGYEAEIQEQFDQSTVSYEFRLFEIVGATPGTPGYTEDPTANAGSELDQQYRSIEVARLRIQRNDAEISNLWKELQIERERSAAVSDIRIRYGDAQADMTEWIGHINAAQAAANALADALTVEKLTTGLFFGYLANAAVQGAGEELKGQIEAEKERLAAMEQAAIEGVESEARVKTLMLAMNTLVIDSQEAALLLQQEAARMTALYREKRTLEARVDERNESLASRYFADPLHRLATLSDMGSANLSFEEAQKWLFFMVRALEYKWNTPFRNYSFDGRTYSSQTVYRLRNAEELVDFYQAMVNYDEEVNRGRQPETSWFSFREHHLGFVDGVDQSGDPLLYRDPGTGERVPAIEAFRRHLARHLRQVSNGEQIVLSFSTAREIPGENFFLGPTFAVDHQTVISKGAFLDKIDGLFIRLPGSHTLGRTTIPGVLTYGGTSFLRNFDVGAFDPQRPDRLRNELTAYSTRYWFFHAPSSSWRFTEAFSNPVTMTVSGAPFQPTTDEEIVVLRERSVATTGWELAITVRSGQTQLLRIDELTDVELQFKHSAISRQ